MSEAKTILSSLLLALQFCLGFWQILKLTLFGALVQGILGLWISRLPLGLGSRLSPTYARLKTFGDGIFKKVKCHAIPAGDEPALPRQIPHEMPDEIHFDYLGKSFNLERKEGSKLFVEGKMAYYITDAIWSSLLDMGRLASLPTVFVKGGYKVIQGGAIGGVMELSEVLDCLILENHIIKPIDNVVVLPIDLSVSEEKVLKALNLMGLFLQTKKHVHWLIPTLFSFTAAVLEFCTPLRVWLYSNINLIFNGTLHLICDRLPLRTRAIAFLYAQLVVELDPFSDIEWRVVRGDIVGVVSGGAKCHKDDATLVEPLSPRLSGVILVEPLSPRLSEGQTSISLDLKYALCELSFDATRGKCEIWGKLNVQGTINQDL